MTTEYDFTKDLVASLFAKTAEAVAAAPRKDLEEILNHHENLLLGVMNNSRLLHIWTTQPADRKPLVAMTRGLAQRAVSKEVHAAIEAAQPAGDGKAAAAPAEHGVRAVPSGKVAA